MFQRISVALGPPLDGMHAVCLPMPFRVVFHVLGIHHDWLGQIPVPQSLNSLGGWRALDFSVHIPLSRNYVVVIPLVVIIYTNSSKCQYLKASKDIVRILS